MALVAPLTTSNAEYLVPRYGTVWTLDTHLDLGDSVEGYDETQDDHLRLLNLLPSATRLTLITSLHILRTYSVYRDITHYCIATPGL